jgi:hypothetical protein
VSVHKVESLDQNVRSYTLEARKAQFTCRKSAYLSERNAALKDIVDRLYCAIRKDSGLCGSFPAATSSLCLAFGVSDSSRGVFVLILIHLPLRKALCDSFNDNVQNFGN